jgi:hypothetical protein
MGLERFKDMSPDELWDSTASSMLFLRRGSLRERTNSKSASDCSKRNSPSAVSQSINLRNAARSVQIRLWRMVPRSPSFAATPICTQSSRGH